MNGMNEGTNARGTPPPMPTVNFSRALVSVQVMQLVEIKRNEKDESMHKKPQVGV